MTGSEPFIDHYSILEVDWDCDPRTLEYAYRRLAKLYHPDHSESADVTKLNEVIAAYRALRDPDARAEYDASYIPHSGATGPTPFPRNESDADEIAALNDAEVHEKILKLLYKRRREHAQDAGVPQFTIQEMTHCSDAVFDFHVWYLKSRGFIASTEEGTLAITIDGVDQVISRSRTKKAEKLQISQSRDDP